jgi:isochorismate hydrolase
MNIDHKRHNKFTFRPAEAALLIIDMQNYFTDKSSHAFIPSSSAIIPRINKLAEAFQAAKRPVIFTKHIDIDPNNMMSHWWEDRIEEPGPLSEINRALDKSIGKIIIKHQYDAFYNTNLEELLRRSGTKQVVITGVVTHLCCETTARAAFVRDFEVYFATDCTAAKDIEHHEAAIFNLAHGFAVPTKSEKLLCHIKQS